MGICRIFPQWIVSDNLNKLLTRALQPIIQIPLISMFKKFTLKSNLVFIYHTFNLVICVHNSKTSCVPQTFMLTASLSFSSNRTVAAAWKTSCTFDINVWRSIKVKPNPVRAQSPPIATILWRNLGTSSRSLSKTLLIKTSFWINFNKKMDNFIELPNHRISRLVLCEYLYLSLV